MKKKIDNKSKMLIQTLIFLYIKLKLKMFMKAYTKIKSYLTSIIIQKIQNIIAVQII